jgi:hypothetical protein
MCLFLKEECFFYVNTSGDISDVAKKLWQHTSNQQATWQWQTTGNSSLPGLNECHGWPHYWSPLLFNSFADIGPWVFKLLSCFVSWRRHTFVQDTTPKTGQLSHASPLTNYSHLNKKTLPVPSPFKRPQHPGGRREQTTVIPSQKYIHQKSGILVET